MVALLAQAWLLPLAVPTSAADEVKSGFVLRGTLRDQYLVKDERRYEAPFELLANEGEFRIRSTGPASKPPLAQLFASDYRNSYLCTLLIKDGAPDEKSAMATLRGGMAIDQLPDRIGFVVWTWLASRLPASGEHDQWFLDLTPPNCAIQRARRQQATLIPQIVRDRAGHVTGVRLWANLGETNPQRLEPSGTVYLAAELSLAIDSAGRPREASLTVHAVRPSKDRPGRLQTEPARRLSYRADAVPLDDRGILQRISFVAERDPPAVFVHDYRFPNDSVHGYRAYRIEAGQPLPFDLLKAPPGNR